jgi:predicted TIM-barrel fold metal-dependent hydrolase
MIMAVSQGFSVVSFGFCSIRLALVCFICCSMQAQALIDYHQHLLMRSQVNAPGGPQSFSAAELIKLMDQAKIRRALVLSMAYRYGNPNKPPVENEYDQVRSENDWTSGQVALFPDRLRGFCGVDPLKDYALKEIERCSKDRYLHGGLKLHFGNSDVDLDNPDHVQRLQKVFGAAANHGMAIVVHMHASVTKGRPYGAKEANIFLTEVLPSAGTSFVQIAHLTGAGGYDDPGTDAALQVFTTAISRNDSRMRNVYFDICGVAGLGNWRAKKYLIVQRIRAVGVHRILFGSDGAFGAGTTPAVAYAAFRELPLTDEEFQIIEHNIAPYMQ